MRNTKYLISKIRFPKAIHRTSVLEVLWAAFGKPFLLLSADSRLAPRWCCGIWGSGVPGFAGVGPCPQRLCLHSRLWVLALRTLLGWCVCWNWSLWDKFSAFEKHILMFWSKHSVKMYVWTTVTVGFFLPFNINGVYKSSVTYLC